MTDAETTDAEMMALCAIRYCMGRSSYIVADGLRWAREWGEKSAVVKEILVRDIDNMPAGLLGHTHESEWRALADELRRTLP